MRNIDECGKNVTTKTYESEEITLIGLVNLLETHCTGFIRFKSGGENGLQPSTKLYRQTCLLYYWEDDNIPHMKELWLIIEKSGIHSYYEGEINEYGRLIQSIGRNHIWNLFKQNVPLVDMVYKVPQISVADRIASLIIENLDGDISWYNEKIYYAERVLLSDRTEMVCRRHDASNNHPHAYEYRMDIFRTNNSFDTIDSSTVSLIEVIDFIDTIAFKKFCPYVVNDKMNIDEKDITFLRREIYDEIISYHYLVNHNCDIGKGDKIISQRQEKKKRKKNIKYDYSLALSELYCNKTLRIAESYEEFDKDPSKYTGFMREPIIICMTTDKLEKTMLDYYKDEEITTHSIIKHLKENDFLLSSNDGKTTMKVHSVRYLHIKKRVVESYHKNHVNDK